MQKKNKYWLKLIFFQCLKYDFFSLCLQNWRRSCFFNFLRQVMERWLIIKGFWVRYVRQSEWDNFKKTKKLKSMFVRDEDNDLTFLFCKNCLIVIAKNKFSLKHPFNWKNIYFHFSCSYSLNKNKAKDDFFWTVSTISISFKFIFIKIFYVKLSETLYLQ
jgi:hypothetical protein